MCKFLSLIVTKSGKIYGNGSVDSHEEIISQHKADKELEDNKLPPDNTFARIEVTPVDNDIFNHKPSNWKVRVDEEIKPKWWNQVLEKKCFTVAKKVLKKQFIINQEIEELSDDVRFIKNSKITVLKSKVGEMWGSSQVGEMWDSSQVGEMLGSSQVGEMFGSSQVGEMLGSNTVNVWSRDCRIKKQVNGSSVVIKRYLKNVKVVIK